MVKHLIYYCHKSYTFKSRDEESQKNIYLLLFVIIPSINYIKFELLLNLYSILKSETFKFIELHYSVFHI